MEFSKPCITKTSNNIDLQVKIIPTQMVKPSSTIIPSRITHYKLCLLDQFFGLLYVPQVLFYNNNNTTLKTLTCDLKDSLSETLSLYYPVAGRLGETDRISTVECNDKGVSFVNTQIDCSLVEYLRHESRVEVVPAIDTTPLDWTEMVLLAIQVTEFSCGGVAIGSQCLHKVVDGASWTNFLKTWAAIASRRNEDVVVPDFTTAVSIFPLCPWAEALSSLQRPVPRTVRSLGGTDQNGSRTCLGKAFVFSANSIRALQTKGRSGEVPNPTRVEALSSFIWKHAIIAAISATHYLNSNSVSGKSALIHSVNIRPRVNPPLPSTSFGNLITYAIAHFNCKEYKARQINKSNLNLPDLVVQVRKSLSEAKDPVRLRNLLIDLHVPFSKATLVYCDNMSAIYLSVNPVQHQRTKHIEMDIHFVREKVEKGEIRVRHIPSRYQIADIFTKGLPLVLFDDFRDRLNVRDPPASTAGVC